MPGGPDAQGVYKYAGDDNFATAHQMLNELGDSVSTQLALDRNRLDDLDGDTGWINLAYQSGATTANGLTGQYRRKGGIVYLRGRVSRGSAATIATLPAGFRPGQDLRYSVADGSSGASSVTSLTIATTGEIGAASGGVPNLGIAIFHAEN